MEGEETIKVSTGRSTGTFKVEDMGEVNILFRTYRENLKSESGVEYAVYNNMLGTPAYARRGRAWYKLTNIDVVLN